MAPNRKIDLDTISGHQRQHTPAADLIEREERKERTEKAKNDKPFTIWTTKENVRKWKAYQRARKATLATQAAFVEAARAEYMMNHPVTLEEREALQRERDEILQNLEF